MVVEKGIGVSVELPVTIAMYPQQLAQGKVYFLDFLHSQRFVQCIQLSDIFISDEIGWMAIKFLPFFARYMAKGRVRDTVVRFDHTYRVGGCCKNRQNAGYSHIPVKQMVVSWFKGRL